MAELEWGDYMTKIEFERAKHLETEIQKVNTDIVGLRKCFYYGDTTISTLGMSAMVVIPTEMKELIYNQLKDNYEKKLAELEKEFSELINDD